MEQFGSLRPIVIAVSKFSFIMQDERQNFLDHVHRIATQYTSDLGTDSIHFIDSRDALKAKLTGDQKLLTLSGFDRFESYFINNLLPKVRRNRLNGIFQKIEWINKRLNALIEIQYNIDTPGEKRACDAFRERFEELLGAQMQIELIKQELNGLHAYFE